MHQWSIACMSIIFIISITTFQVTEATGFTIDLIHKDSLQSPSTTFERVTKSIQRSFNRGKILSQDRSPQSPSTDIIPDNGEYLMRFFLGTPPVEAVAVADTCSDLTWIQCKPCIGCFEQKAHFFDANQSSTYKPLPCSSNTCNELPRSSCDHTRHTCRYEVLYGDSSYSNGDLAAETTILGLTTGENVSIPHFTFGCGHEDHGEFSTRANGIVGLGGGQVSLITQTRSSIQGKFSYCLVPFQSQALKQSKLNFGDNAVVSGEGVATTPIFSKGGYTFYFLTLKGFTVGKLRLNYVDSSSTASSQNGVSFGEVNIIRLWNNVSFPAICVVR